MNLHSAALSRLSRIPARFWFWITGAAALVWFLVRVIPKPQRAAYPCMRAAYPLASSFVLALAGVLGISLVSGLKIPEAPAKNHGFRSSLEQLVQALGSWKGRMFLIAGLGLVLAGGMFVVPGCANQPASGVMKVQEANKPMGTARGMYPGRVVWVHDADATNQKCVPDDPDSPWWATENNNQKVIDAMLSKGLQDLTGKASDKEAWDAAFRYHNTQVGKGDHAYKAGEMIFIKTNATSTWSQNIDKSTLEHDTSSPWYGIAETSPQVVLSLLRQLVNQAGIPEEDIWVGDPMKHIYQSHYLLWSGEFPKVHYLDCDSTDLGREFAFPSETAAIRYSDKGSVLKYQEDKLYAIYEKAEYLLNVPTMKGHKYAGVTMFAKNHFGSQTRGDAQHLHAGLVRINDKGTRRSGYGVYRVQVDLMGHDLLGKKNLLFLMDALYTSPMEIAKPVKWKLPPFNNDWTSSLFLSFDNVAIESVGYDFLKAEFNDTSNPDGAWPQMSGADDYLEQAADPANWPKGLVYDPNGSGIPLGSLGVHEHWNDAALKQYSRNLGSGQGIELVPVEL